MISTLLVADNLYLFKLVLSIREKSIAIGMMVLMNTIKQMFEQVLSITSSSEKNFNGLITRPHALALLKILCDISNYYSLCVNV